MTDTQPKKTGKSFLQRIKTYFLTGLVVASPVGITVYLAVAFIEMIDRNIKPMIPASYNPETYLPFPLPGIGLVFLFLLLTALGFFAANFLGRSLIRIGEKILNRMPVVRGVYNTLKQIFETVISENASSFQEVVLVEYPRKGLWAIAFVSGENTGEIQSRISKDVINVFVPTTPNPTSGFLLFVPKKDIIRLDMTPDEGAKYVISAGLVDPSALPVRKEPEK